LWFSQLQEQLLESLDGFEVGVDFPDVILSPKVGLIDLRKSVYAVGGVMGVLIPSSCLIKSTKLDDGVRAESDDSSEGKEADLGVLSWSRVGLLAGILHICM